MCVLGRRDTFVALGGFDESFGIGNGEDLELCERIRRSGRQLRVADGAVVLHHGSATFATMPIEYAGLLRVGNRLAPSVRPSWSDRVGVVLSDGDPAAAHATARSLVPIVDRVVVVERTSLVATELAVGDLAEMDVSVVPGDWCSTRVDTLLGPRAATLAVTAGEQVVYDDWGAVRCELDEIGDEAVVLAHGHWSRRLVGQHDDLTDWTERRPVPAVDTLEIRGDR